MDTQAIRERWREVIPTLSDQAKERVNGETSWVCPLCGHGSNGDGLTLNPTGKPGALKCFGSCGFSGDIIDLWQQVHNVGFRQAVDSIASLLGIAVSEKQEPRHIQNEKPVPASNEQEKNFEPFFTKAIPFLKARFPAGYRGISLETLEAFRCGYAEKWKHPDLKPETAGKVPPSPRLIVPTSRGSYIAVDVRESIPETAKPFRKQKAGKVHWLNVAALEQEKPCFIVEGELDALSIIDAGGAAVGIGSINQRQKFFETVKANPPACTLILALDNDEPGRKAQKELAAELRPAGIPFLSADTANLYGGGKDANEALQQDRDGFERRVKDAMTDKECTELTREKVHNLSEMERPQEEDPWSSSIDSFWENVKGGAYHPVKTGIPAIDELMGGGFMRKQLYVVGAAPGMGKTALCQWIVEYMANECVENFSCMYFCFEMSKDQLIARSLSRWLFELGTNISPMGILKGEMLHKVEPIARWYEGISCCVAYNPGGQGDILPSSSLAAVLREMEKGAKWQESHGKPAPFIVIDYLQLLDVKGKDEQETVKQAMKALKDYAVRWNTCIIVVVANNRESNKSGAASMFSGRGSSSIEYGADAVLSLVYTKDLAECKAVYHDEDTIHRSLVAVKGRFLPAGHRVDFEFNGAGMSFVVVKEQKMKLAVNQTALKRLK